DGDAPVYNHVGGGNDTEEASDETTFRKVYKHLMNGVSNMLPFVVSGGILIALAFLLDDYAINPANFGSNTPIAAFLKSIGDVAFGFMLPVLAGYIAYSIADRPALVVGFVGGMLANTGGSGFLGALLAGFIAGYLVLGLKKLFSFLPESLDGIKPVLLFPLFGTLFMGIIMTFIVIPPVAALNELVINFLNSLGTSSKLLLGIVLGGMMAVDMGGPINKAAYVFGVASLDAGQYEIMAAVMAGGMVPPLAIALATTFFKNRFTKEQRDSGKVNYVMGLSFITEGAIPFAAADPLKVIPACVAGSAIAGALSMMFNVTLRAPHGGIFVVPVVGNPIAYLGAIIAGSLVGMVLLAILKKPIEEAN
ncbi:MAG: PTS fructose transporter subunit IIC, partial [Paraclostridium sp.]